MVTSSLTIDEIDEAKEREDLKILEAVFFVSGRFLNIQELISLSDLNPIVIKDLIEKLKEKYDVEDSALEIVEKSGQWKMDVKPDYKHLVNKLATGSSEFTKAEQETLAIVAFKQPIKQSVIIKIRGNKAYDHIKKFAGLGLIKKRKMGHTHELSLSDDFYDYFNISEADRKSIPKINEKVKKQIEVAEQEVAEEESALGALEEISEDLEDLNEEHLVSKVVKEKSGLEKIAVEPVSEPESESEKSVPIEPVKVVIEEKEKIPEDETAEEILEDVVEEEVEILEKEYERVKKEIKASSDEFKEPSKDYVEEIFDDETAEEILEDVVAEEVIND